MQEVKFKKHTQVEVESVRGLLENNRYVGYINEHKGKFVIAKIGPTYFWVNMFFSFFEVNFDYIDENEEEIKTYKYYVFDSAKELYKWMANEE